MYACVFVYVCVFVVNVSDDFARFSGATHGIMIGHVTPEAQDGGPIALIKVYLKLFLRRL